MRKKFGPSTDVRTQAREARPLLPETRRCGLPRVADLLAISALALGGCSQSTGDILRADPAMKAAAPRPSAEPPAPAASSAHIAPIDVPIDIEGDIAVVKPTPLPKPACTTGCPKP